MKRFTHAVVWRTIASYTDLERGREAAVLKQLELRIYDGTWTLAYVFDVDG